MPTATRVKAASVDVPPAAERRAPPRSRSSSIYSELGLLGSALTVAITERLAPAVAA
jgi:hypothetical protein